MKKKNPSIYCKPRAEYKLEKVGGEALNGH